MQGGHVNWYGDNVLVELADATDEIVAMAAFRVEGRTKLNIRDNDQIDTGFMVNSTYSIIPQGAKRESGSSDYVTAAHLAMAQAKRGMSPAIGIAVRGESAVAVGAEYAVYQEIANAFLFPSVVELLKEMPGIVRAVEKRRNLSGIS